MDQPGETFVYDSAPPQPPVYDVATLPVNMTFDATDLPVVTADRNLYS